MLICDTFNATSCALYRVHDVESRDGSKMMQVGRNLEVPTSGLAFVEKAFATNDGIVQERTE